MDFRTKTTSDLPLVSVGVFSYNYAEYVLDTLDSIYKQTYPHIEFFVVDDGSVDNSVELIQQWIEDNHVECTFIIHQVNKGRNPAINNFLNQAKGKYIVLFASDDEMNPKRIEEQVKLMEKAGDEYYVCYSDAELMNEQGEYRGLFSEKVKSPFLSGNVFEEYYFQRFHMAAPTIMFRRKIYDKVGVYDPRLTAEDYDMWMRMLPVVKVIFCEYPGTKYRIKENQSLTPSHEFNLQQWYHKDRIIIYKKLVNLLEKLQKWPHIQEAASRKISFHLIHLKKLRSPYFSQMISFLLKNAYYKIPVARLLRLQFNQLMPQKETSKI
ncbi:MAG: glycosyltransferase [Segetibacter sp.]|nr:glycosyltransferase [Segetibacter sp.]